MSPSAPTTSLTPAGCNGHGSAFNRLVAIPSIYSGSRIIRESSCYVSTSPRRPSLILVTDEFHSLHVLVDFIYMYRRACHGAWIFAHHTFAHFSVLVRNLSFRAVLHASEGPPCNVALAKPLNPKPSLAKPKKTNKTKKKKTNQKTENTKKRKNKPKKTKKTRIPTSVEILGFFGFFGLFDFLVFFGFFGFVWFFWFFGAWGHIKDSRKDGRHPEGALPGP